MIVSVREKRTGRSGTISLDGSRSYTRRFFVETDSFGTSVAAIKAHPGIPNIGDPYFTPNEVDPGALVTKVAPRQLASPVVWEVEVVYSVTIGESEDPAQSDPNPLNRPPVISYSFREVERVLERANLFVDTSTTEENVPVTNSAGMPFEPPPTYTDYALTIRITRNIAEYYYDFAMRVIGRTNSDYFFTFPPRTLRLLDYSGSSAFEGDLFYFKLSAEIETNLDGYDRRVLDRSRYQLVSGVLSVILDGDGMPVADPVLLDGNGEKLAASADPVFRTYRALKEAQFAGLGLI